MKSIKRRILMNVTRCIDYVCFIFSRESKNTKSMNVRVVKTLIRYIEYGLLSSIPFIIFIGNRISTGLIRSFSFFIFLLLFARHQYYHVSSHHKLKGFLSYFVIPYGIFAFISGLTFYFLPAQLFNTVFLPLRMVEFLENVTTLQSMLIVHVVNIGVALVFTMLGIRQRIKWLNAHRPDEEEIPEWILERRKMKNTIEFHKSEEENNE